MRKILVEVKLSGVVEPDSIRKVVNILKEQVEFSKPMIVGITGRMPIWLAESIVHYFHPAVAILQFDPRIGYIVVSSHHRDYEEGTVVENIEFDEKIEIPL